MQTLEFQCSLTWQTSNCVITIKRSDLRFPFIFSKEEVPNLGMRSITAYEKVTNCFGAIGELGGHLGAIGVDINQSLSVL